VSPEGYPYYFHAESGRSEWVQFENPGNIIVEEEAVVVVTTTVPTKDLGKLIAQSLISEKLAACVQLLDGGITSFYEWKGVLEESNEIKIIIKVMTILQF
jgi:hypothetical protein